MQKILENQTSFIKEKNLWKKKSILIPMCNVNNFKFILH